MNNSKRRYISILTGILFLFITFASLFFIAKEETHECTGQDCPICACIHQAEHILNHLGSDMSAVVFMAVFFLFFFLFFFYGGYSCVFYPFVVQTVLGCF